jgi:hypothetical protein
MQKTRVWDFKTNAESCIEFIEKPAKELYQDGSQM